MEYRRAALVSLAAVVTTTAVVFSGGETAGAAAVALPVIMVTPMDRGLFGILLWIVAGAVVLGAVGWAIVTVLAPHLPPVVGLGIGIALGGGFGAVVRLLALEDPVDTTETVSVDAASDESVSGPEPADLFEAHPDPILYYDTADDNPVVRAANPAFVDSFDVSASMVEGTPLGDALMFRDTDALVTAIRENERYDAVHTCDTVEGEVSFRVRTATTADATAGYVLYTADESA